MLGGPHLVHESPPPVHSRPSDKPWHICAAQAEPTFRAQLWRTVRTLFVAFVVLSGVGALMEERGLTKGILNKQDMRPQMEMKTRFADVKVRARGLTDRPKLSPSCLCKSGARLCCLLSPHGSLP